MRYNKTSSCTERWRVRSCERGAIFIEAVVVISTLTLCLIALCYVRDLYVRQLGVSRLARAAVVAHSMAGCKGELPRDWLARDVGRYELHNPNQDRKSARGRDSAGAGAPGNARSRSLLQRAGGTSSDGEGILNPITDTEVGGETSASGRAGTQTSRRQTMFTGKVRARSFVSCGDEVRDGDFDQILGVLKDDIGNILGR